jgi:hypothetical protein
VDIVQSKMMILLLRIDHKDMEYNQDFPQGYEYQQDIYDKQ